MSALILKWSREVGVEANIDNQSKSLSHTLISSLDSSSVGWSMLSLIILENLFFIDSSSPSRRSVTSTASFLSAEVSIRRMAYFSVTKMLPSKSLVCENQMPWIAKISF